jgi:ankyrin repeat protein
MFIKNKIVAALILAGLLISSRAVMAHHASCPDLHAAAFLDEPGELSGLLGHGADLNCRDSIKQTPLITAAEGASLSIVKILLGHGVSVNARDEIGQTALLKARQKLAYFDREGGEVYRDLFREMITLLEQAGATE